MSDELFDSTPDNTPSGPALCIPASSSVLVASSSELVDLGTIHNDIKMFHFSFLAVFCLIFTLFMIRGWRR